VQRKARLQASKPLVRKAPLVSRTELRRGAPLPAVSPKRAAKLATGRPAKRPRSTGPDRLTVDAVLERDNWACARCGCGIHGERGVGWSIQHRRARGAGGTSRPDANSPANQLTLCGSGTTGCHGRVERRGEADRAAGFWIRQTDDPTAVPVLHAVHGWVWLTDDAGWSADPPGEVAA